MSKKSDDRNRAYWRANNRLIFVEALNQITFFGLPLGFWFAQQGSIYVFVLLILFYAWRMDAIDRAYHMDDE